MHLGNVAMKINSKAYWDDRFGSRDWQAKGGLIQTEEHAKRYIGHLEIAADFDGTICDFGCAEGNAIPVYKQHFAKARLMGVDLSSRAIEQATARFGSMATFSAGEAITVPDCDIIISSHTFEHIDNHTEVLETLLPKCRRLLVIVPYREDPLDPEHVRRYDEDSYADFGCVRTAVCGAGWSYRGFNLLYQVHMKNIIRPAIGRKVVRERLQIVFEFKGQRAA